MSELKFVIFDCDGVLVDSEKITNILFMEMVGGLGLNLTLEEVVTEYVGNNMEFVKKRLLDRHQIVVPNTFASEFHHASLKLLAKNLKPIGGIENAIDGLSVPFGVASNSSLDKVTLMLKKTNLYEKFEGQIYTSSLVNAPKPAPDLYLYVANKHEVAPKNILVIEDTHTGVSAAVAAGMKVFGYTGTHSAERLKKVGAHVTFDKMDDLHELIEAEFGSQTLIN